MSPFPVADCDAVPRLFPALNLSAAQSALVAAASASDFALPSFVSGLIGNCCAIVILASSWKRQRQTIFYRLIFALILVDLAGQMLTSPFVLRLYVNGRNWSEIGGPNVCHFYSFNMLTAAFNTIFMATVIAIERCLALRKPFLYDRLVRPHHAFHCIILAFACSCAIACLPALGVPSLGANVVMFPYTWSFFDMRFDETRHVFPYVFSLVGLFSIGVTAVGNFISILTMCQMRRYRKRFSGSFRERQGVKSRDAAERKADAEMLALTLALFAFASLWAPLMVSVFINQVSGANVVGGDLFFSLVKLACVNQILDPWFYILFRIFFHDNFLKVCRRLRDAAKRALRCLRCRPVVARQRLQHMISTTTQRQTSVTLAANGSAVVGDHLLESFEAVSGGKERSHSNGCYEWADGDLEQNGIKMKALGGVAGRRISGVRNASNLRDSLMTNGYMTADSGDALKTSSDD